MADLRTETLDLVTEAVARYAASGKLLLWNRAFEEFVAPVELRTGLQFEDIVRASAPIRVAQGHASSVEDYIRSRLDFHRHRGRISERRIGERVYALQERSTPDGGWLESVTDVTDLRRQEVLLAAILESLPIGVAHFDSNERLLQWNQAYRDLYHEHTGYPITRGETLEELVSRHVAASGLEGRELEHEVERRLHAQRSMEDIDIAVGARDLIIRKSRAPRGGVVSNVLDVSALKQAQRDLERSNQDLAQFASIASHDLQEPLRTIGSFASLLGRRYRDELDDTARNYIDFITDGAARMQRLIRDLLAYSRAGTTEPMPSAVDLDRALALVKNDLTSRIEDAGATVEGDGLGQVVVDGGQLQQVLRNLITNALTYRSEQPPAVTVSNECSSVEWCIRISDNGIGIAPEDRTQVFQVFKRLHSAAEYPGTGIGLASCERMVQRWGGRIWVEPNGEQGSTFCFTIPRP